MDEEMLRRAARAELAAGAVAGHHPGAEELVSYAAGELDGAPREHLQEHLARCPDCARAVLDLRAFPDLEPPQGVPPPDREEAAALWEGLARATGVPPARRPAPEVRRLPRAAVVAYALAASLLAATAGLSVWVIQLRGELAQPRPNVFIADLLPPEAGLRRGEGSAQRLTVPPAADRLVLLLNLADLRDYPGYEVELIDASGQRVWRLAGLERNRAGGFTLEVPRSLLPAGAYRLRLIGLGVGGPEPMVDYPFHVEYENA